MYKRQPYLAEPFDVQHYQSVFGGDSVGNKEVACQPVWSKIKAASSVGAIGNAQNGGGKQLYISWTTVDRCNIGKQASFGEVLHALRPILRYEDTVTTFILPLVFLTAVDSGGENNHNLRDF